jgi:peroxiredoxin
MGKIKRLIRTATSVVLTILIAISCLSFLSFHAKQVSADSGCNVDSLSTNSATVGNDTGFIFQVSDSSASIQWASITSPGANVVLYDAVSPDFSAQVNNSQATFTSGNVPAGSEAELYVAAHIEYYLPPGNWTVQVSSEPSGANPVTCSGDTSFQSINSGGSNPPVISSVSADVTSSTSATISWQTDEVATSTVYYGVTEGYGQQQNDTSFVTSHSVTITGLQPNTGYDYEVTSVDQNGDGSTSGNNTFLTPPPPAPPPPAINPVINSGGSTSTSSNIPLPVALSLGIKPKSKSSGPPPVVQLSTKLVNPYKVVPTISGQASGSMSILAVEYSTDGGKDWLPVDTSVGLGSQQVSFSFTPTYLDDGNYQVIVRAIDSSGNIGTTPSQTLVLDRLPPIIGGNVVTIGTQLLEPKVNGILTLPANVNAKITVGAIGGPTSVNVLAFDQDDKTAAPLSFQLTYIESSGLWQGIINFSRAGNYQLVVQAVDGAGNSTSRDLNMVTVNPPGQITAASNGKSINAQLTTYYLDPDTNTWVEWDGPAFGQQNPLQLTNRQNGYSLFLPAGTYYLKITSSGYHTVISQSFSVSKLTSISASFALQRAFGLHAGPLKIYYSWSGLSAKPLNGATWKMAPIVKQPPVLNNELPQFNLPLTNGQSLTNAQLLGKPTILTFINTWAPSAQDQLNNLNHLNQVGLNIVPVGMGESTASLGVYDAIAGYHLPILADTDEQLTTIFGVNSLPTTFFVDRHGVVKKVMVGVLSTEELLANVQY